MRAGDQQDTTVEFRYPLVALALTTAVAGLIDAFTLLRYGVFTANQSGNIVHVGMGLSGRFPQWLVALASIVGFGVGSVVAVRLRRSSRTSPPVNELVGVIAVLALWATADILLDSGRRERTHQVLLAALAALGVGILAMLFLHTTGIKTSTTYQTSTEPFKVSWTLIGQSFCSRVCSSGGLIQATVGSLGGLGRRLNRSGLRA